MLGQVSRCTATRSLQYRTGNFIIAKVGVFLKKDYIVKFIIWSVVFQFTSQLNRLSEFNLS